MRRLILPLLLVVACKPTTDIDTGDTDPGVDTDPTGPLPFEVTDYTAWAGRVSFVYGNSTSPDDFDCTLYFDTVAEPVTTRRCEVCVAAFQLSFTYDEDASDDPIRTCVLLDQHTQADRVFGLEPTDDPEDAEEGTQTFAVWQKSESTQTGWVLTPSFTVTMGPLLSRSAPLPVTWSGGAYDVESEGQYRTNYYEGEAELRP